MSELYEMLKSEIELNGYMSARTLKFKYGVTQAALDALVSEGKLCVLSDGSCYDLPERRDKRVAYWHQIIQEKAKRRG